MMIDKILQFSIQYRYIVVVCTLLVGFLGLYFLKDLPIDAVPDITNNQVQINTSVSALSPEEMEKRVTLPIETALSGIPGLQSTRSISRNGFSQVTAIFDDHLNIYFARQQINERLNEVREHLPSEADPKMGPISTGLGEIYMWTVEFEDYHKASIVNGRPGWQSDKSFLTPDGEKLSSEIELLAYLRSIQDGMIRPQLKNIKGLADIDAIGGYIKQYHIEPNIQKMLELGISFQEIIDAVKNDNLSIGAGYIEKNRQSLAIKADARFQTIKDLEQVILKNSSNSLILLKDIADVKVGKELRTGAATENGKEVVIGTAMMLIGSNSRSVSKSIDHQMDKIRANLPPGIISKTLLNRTKLVDATIQTVSKNLLEGALLVIAILFLLLGNISAALITACVIPLSMLLTGMGMIQNKISGNLMSLGALDFGLIVDGAVIIIENYLRKLGLKQQELKRLLSLEERLSIASASAKEMVKPSVFGQLIIMIVYIPLLTFEGVEGKMFHPMAATVLLALFSAFILSLTFVPAASAIFVKQAAHHGSKSLEKAKNLYEQGLNWVLPNAGFTVGIGIFMMALSLILASKMGQEFIPTLDEQDLALQAMRIPGTSLSQAIEMQKEVELTVKKFPQVEFIFSKTGTAEMASDPMPPNISDTFVMLKPRKEWPNPVLKKENLIQQIEESLKNLVGNNYEFTQPIEMRFNELIAGVKSDVAVKVYGDNFKTMQETAENIGKVLGKIPGAADVKVSQTEGLPLIDIAIDRSALQLFNVNMKDITNVLSVALGGEKVGEILEGDRKSDVFVRLPEKYRDDPFSWSFLPVSIGNHQLTPLKNFCSFKEKEGICEIHRENGKRLVIAEANVRGSDLGSFVSRAKNSIKNKVKIPPGYWIEWGGQFQNLLSAKERLLFVIPLCLLMIFVLLYAAFQSIKEALLVFIGIPLAMTGGIITLWLREMPISLSAAVGFIALSGIAVLNGLVMLNSINHHLASGYSLNKAILEGCLNRLRPILMTALVASLGFVPMAFASGTGAEVQKPLATVVIGGLMSSTFLTLFLLPALCTLLAVGQRKHHEIQNPS